ncbi:MAG: energy transducer TonB [Candidatus Latescibacterota bacterium]
MKLPSANRISYNRQAYLVSFLFHAVLLLLLLAVPVYFEIEERPVFYELNLGTISQQRMEQILGEARRTETAARLRREGMSPRERLEVPKRRMVELEEPSITVTEPQKLESDDIVQKAERQKMEIESPRPEVPLADKEIFSMDRKETYEGSKISVGDTPGTGIEAGTIGREMAKSFEIEGEIKGRELIFNPLPAYPEGLNKNATIRISFSVQPDGNIAPAGMAPVRKENAVLEELTMNVLKRWRFTPLPAGDTRNQKGMITFYYKVR